MLIRAISGIRVPAQPRISDVPWQRKSGSQGTRRGHIQPHCLAENAGKRENLHSFNPRLAHAPASPSPPPSSAHRSRDPAGRMRRDGTFRAASSRCRHQRHRNPACRVAAGEALPERVVSPSRTMPPGIRLPGVSVTFAVTAHRRQRRSGDSHHRRSGEARTRWTLGGTPGQQTMVVNARPAARSVQITALAGLRASHRSRSTPATTRSASSGTCAGRSNPSVIARDAAGSPVQGVTVIFNVMSGRRHGRPAVEPSPMRRASRRQAGGRSAGSVGTQLLSAQVPQVGRHEQPARLRGDGRLRVRRRPSSAAFR